MIELVGVDVCRGRHTVLHDVTFRPQAGRLHAVLGPNGAGKSTVIAALSGDLAASSGTVHLDGSCLSSWSIRDQALLRAVVPQETTAAFDFEVLDVVMLGRYALHGGREETTDADAAWAAMAAMDVDHLAERSIRALSGGERQRVLLARAMAQLDHDRHALGGRVLLLDEPTANLDLAHQHRTMATVRRLADERGWTVVVVLHDLGLALRYAHDATLLERGRIVASGAVEGVMTDDVLSRLYGVGVRVSRADAAIGPVVVVDPV